MTFFNFLIVCTLCQPKKYDVKMIISKRVFQIVSQIMHIIKSEVMMSIAPCFKSMHLLKLQNPPKDKTILVLCIAHFLNGRLAKMITDDSAKK